MSVRHPLGYWLAVCLVVFARGVKSSAEEARRPRITGVAHVALFAHDLDRALTFYKDFLGFPEPFRLNSPEGAAQLVFLKVNDRQYLELSPEKEPETDRLNHFALEVENAEAMRAYLATRGTKVPETVPVGRIGNANFMLTDPDGHRVEIVEYLPEGRTAAVRGKFLGETRISTRIMHVGVSVSSLDRAFTFYGQRLAFKEIWRGSADGKRLSWVNVKVPEGDDYVEFMLSKEPPSRSRLGTMHHICLEVPNIEAAAATLRSRAATVGYERPLTIRTGTNRKRQLNLYDPDGTRIELMEPKSVDGNAAPTSTAPPP